MTFKMVATPPSVLETWLEQQLGSIQDPHRTVVTVAIERAAKSVALYESLFPVYQSFTCVLGGPASI